MRLMVTANVPTYGLKYKPYDEMEHDAILMLCGFEGGKFLTVPQALDVDSFVEFYMNATIDYARLSQDGSILGLSTLAQTSVTVFSEDGIAQSRSYPEDTILLDVDIYLHSSSARSRFTFMHECAHLYYHKHLAAAVQYCNEGNQKNRCELQANCLAAALLMPEPMVRRAFDNELKGKRWSELSQLEKISVVKNLSALFQVSVDAMKFRMKNLKLCC